MKECNEVQTSLKHKIKSCLNDKICEENYNLIFSFSKTNEKDPYNS